MGLPISDGVGEAAAVVRLLERERDRLVYEARGRALRREARLDAKDARERNEGRRDDAVARHGSRTVRLRRGDFLRAVGRPDLARRIETPTSQAPVTIEQQLDAIELEVELAANADERRVWTAVARTLQAAARGRR